MNNYFILRRANRLRVKLLTKTSQEQIREVIRYLRRVSWDACGVELIYSDLIDIAVRANEEGNELFSVISDAETFVNEVKPGLKRLSWFDFFTIAIPVLLFLGWGVEGILLNPLILALMPDYKWEFSLGYLLQFCICAASAFYLFRRMMQASTEICSISVVVCARSVWRGSFSATHIWKNCFCTDFTLAADDWMPCGWCVPFGNPI